MPELRPKVFDYAVELDAGGALSIADADGILPPPGWTADHLLLAALLRCSIESLAYHARREGSDVNASGSASGRVTKRESDGRYAFVSIECRVTATVVPPVSDGQALIAKAERDCFVGASLTVTPQYHWQLR